jgi:hypothetical protein
VDLMAHARDMAKPETLAANAEKIRNALEG